MYACRYSTVQAMFSITSRSSGWTNDIIVALNGSNAALLCLLLCCVTPTSFHGAAEQKSVAAWLKLLRCQAGNCTDAQKSERLLSIPARMHHSIGTAPSSTHGMADCVHASFRADCVHASSAFIDATCSSRMLLRCLTASVRIFCIDLPCRVCVQRPRQKMAPTGPRCAGLRRV